MVEEYAQPDRAAPTIKLSVASDAEVVFSAEEYSCDGKDEWGGKMDVPDAPMRAVRISDGEIAVFTAHYNNVISRSRSLSRFWRTSCTTALNSNKNADPSIFSDREWLVSPVLLPNGKIFGLVHNEFWGGLHDKICAKKLGATMPWESVCLYVNLTGSTSIDGGKSFQRLEGDKKTAAAFPYPFKSDMTRQGVRDPSNIFFNPNDRKYYFTAIVDAYKDQERGSCLFQTDDPSTNKWLTWNGRYFQRTMPSPYPSNTQTEPSTCAPVSKLDFTSVLYSPEYRIFIGFGQEERVKPGGLFYRTSKDLINWSQPILLISGHSFGKWKTGDRFIAYPSLIDPDSSSPNFDTISKSGYVYYQSVRTSLEGKLLGRERDIVRQKIIIKSTPNN